MAYIKTVFKKDLNDNTIPGDENTLVYPVTTTSAVFDGTAQTLDNTLTEIKNDIQDLKDNGTPVGNKSTGVIIMSRLISLGSGTVSVSIDKSKNLYTIQIENMSQELCDYWFAQHQAENVIIVWDNITSNTTIGTSNSKEFNLNTLEFRIMDITNIDEPTTKYTKSLTTIIPEYNKNGYFRSNYPISIKVSQLLTITVNCTILP